MREERGRGRGGAHRGRADLPPPPSFQAGDSDATKLVGSLENAAVFVALVTAMTFALVAAFKAGWSSAIQAYMAVSGFSIFFVLTGIISLQVVATLRMTVDAVTFAFLLWNFAAAGVGALFLLPASPLALKQMYLVVTGVVTAFIFTYVPEWTTWALLGAMAAYDLYAVLTPNGPLRLLVETAIDRGEDIPALVYEGRARVGGGGGGPPPGRRGSSRPLAPLRARRGGDASLPLGVVGFMADTSRTPLLDAEAPAVAAERRELGTAPAQPERERESGRDAPGPAAPPPPPSSSGAGLPDAIKLGLGDFIFYSLLVGRASMYDLLAAAAATLAVIAGLGATLLLLAVRRHALPALPISVALGAIFTAAARLVVEPVVIPAAADMLYF